MFKSKFDTIFCPPVNSSGDVYHIAAYLILCRTMDEIVPQVALFYDTEATKNQAERSKAFLRCLGFTRVRLESLELTSAQAPVRLAKSATAVLSFSDVAVDQKATTSLLSYAQLSYGKFINEAINNHFLQHSLKSKALPAYQWAIAQIDSTLDKIKINNQKFVILNLRHSKKANKDQGFSLEQLKVISKTLAKYGCALIILDVGGKQGKQFSIKYKDGKYATAVAMNVFAEQEHVPVQYDKFPHLIILQQLARLNTCMGVIGNTSGTLDMAAFMGIRTLCVHRFKATSNRKIIVPHQDLRVLLQANIMSVFDYTAGLKAFKKIITQWLSTEQHVLCSMLSDAHKVTLEAGRFKIDHYDRRCFVADSKNVFNAQYLQLTRDQQLSIANSKWVKKYGATNPLTFSSPKIQRSKDDFDLKTQVRNARVGSVPYIKR